MKRQNDEQPAFAKPFCVICSVMVAKTILAILFVTSLAACKQPRQQNNPQHDVPKALENKSTADRTFSKSRYDDDLVESLYNELAEKAEDLKTLENDLQAISESKADSTASFDGFNGKNKSYYTSASAHVDGLRDSFLKTKLRTLLAASLNTYHRAVEKHDALLKTIEAQSVTLTDLHTVLKITRTLPLMEKYQQNNLPPAKSLEGYARKQAEAIKLADTLTKK